MVLVAVLSFACAGNLSAHDFPKPAAKDVVRAFQKIPRHDWRGDNFATMSKKLNSHLVADPNLQTRPCSSFHLTGVQRLQLTLHSVRHTGLQEIYEQTKDNRQLPFLEVSELLATFGRENSLAEKNKNFHDIIRDGRCHAVVMMYAHHLSEATREELSHHIVLPQLPVQRFELESSADADAAFVANTYSDNLNCAKCHLSPDDPVRPVISHYVAASHAPLTQPDSLESKNGVLEVTLHVNVTRIAGGSANGGGGLPPLSYTTRSYNGKVPGPTLRVRPGDLVRITLVNDLEDQTGAPTQANLYRLPNTTNLHLHGLWVAPHDVFSGVSPGDRRVFEYAIPNTHAAGSNW
jgi:hypothetical protein